MARVAFSASMIVLGTLFVYIYELSDGSMLGRDQTMVSRGPCPCLFEWFLTGSLADIYLLRLPRPCICLAKSWTGLWTFPKWHASADGFDFIPRAVDAHLCAIYASNFPDGGS
jgi:hypothetical protein